MGFDIMHIALAFGGELSFELSYSLGQVFHQISLPNRGARGCVSI